MTLDELRKQKPVAVVEDEPTEALEMFPCPGCKNLYSDTEDAADCCADEIEPMYVCPVCKDKERRLREYSNCAFDVIEDCEAHMRAKHGWGLEKPEIRYLDALLFSGRHPLSLQMAQEPDYFDKLRFGKMPLGGMPEGVK